MKTRKLNIMPYDMSFENEKGSFETCHATGIEVEFDEIPGQWWNEYEDSNGNLYYGR